MIDLAVNLRRIMARLGLTVDEVVARCGLDERTVRAMLAGRTRPHARTLGRLAEGLGVEADELFADASLLVYRLFDRQTNPLVQQLIDERPEWFAGWSEADFDELFSRFGAGGALTAEGAAEVVASMNRHRQVHRRVALLLESSQADLLAALVDLLYQRIEVSAP
jgi:transcriptional regulator with XRE-family HTH domain